MPSALILSVGRWSGRIRRERLLRTSFYLRNTLRRKRLRNPYRGIDFLGTQALIVAKRIVSS